MTANPKIGKGERDLGEIEGEVLYRRTAATLTVPEKRDMPS